MVAERRALPTRRELVARFHPDHAWHTVAGAVRLAIGRVEVACTCGKKLIVPVALPGVRPGLSGTEADHLASVPPETAPRGK